MGFIKSMFSRPKAPKANTVEQEGPQATPTPTIDQAAQAAEDAMRLRRRRGRQAYRLSQPGQPAPNVATKTLVGQ